MNRNKSAQYFAMAVLGVLVVIICSSYSGYYAREPNGESLFSYLMNIDTALLQITWNEHTLKIILIGLLVYAVGCMYFISTRKNYRFGEEFGSADFVSAKGVCKMYADKKFEANRIVSQNLRLSYDGRKTQLNNHMLVIGGSGAGKTRYVLKPNLMQMFGSMVITDPDGGTLASTGNMFVKNTYKVKVLNLVNMLSSDCYNPFKYIVEDADILKLTTNLIKNTTPPDTQKGDPFWEDATKMFLQSCIIFIIKLSRKKRTGIP